MIKGALLPAYSSKYCTYLYEHSQKMFLIAQIVLSPLDKHFDSLIYHLRLSGFLSLMSFSGKVMNVNKLQDQFNGIRICNFS